VSPLVAALIAAVVSAVVAPFSQYLWGRRMLTLQLRRQHEQEQRRELYKLISDYHGRVLEAALDWDRRAVQIYRGSYDMLDPPDHKRDDPDQYYYQSVVFRFLQLMSVARRFEAEAFYFDARIADDRDFDLLRYAKAFLWVMIHSEISPDDGLRNLDHFRSDAFRPLLDLCYAEPVGERALLPNTRTRHGELIFDRGRFLKIITHGEELGHERQVHELLEFFDGVRPDEIDGEGRQRRRWDRLVALHLLVLAFIHRCGHSWHRREDLGVRVREAARMLLDPANLHAEFSAWLPKMGLGDDDEIRVVLSELDAVAGASPPDETPPQRATRVLASLAAFQDQATTPRASGRFRRDPATSPEARPTA
jgi:hypothetical protein